MTRVDALPDGHEQAVKRDVPKTPLRHRYERLGSLSTHERRVECERLARNPAELVGEFLDAVCSMQEFDNRGEAFYPGERTRKAAPVLRGAVEVMQRLVDVPIVVRDLPGYTFRIRHREVPPLRATRAGARSSGSGGIDYVALREALAIPILGEIKVRSDRDPYYAFVQLLTYLSEMCSPGQIARARSHLFTPDLPERPRYDLHILLVDFMDRGRKGPIIGATHRLADAFRSQLADCAGIEHGLGEILCLKMSTSGFAGTVDLLWRS